MAWASTASILKQAPSRITRHRPNDPASLSNDSVTAILIDHRGLIWVGNYGGLDRLDPATGKFTHYRYRAGDETSLSHNRVRSLYEDRSGTLWIGTGVPFDLGKPNAGGLNRFDRETGTFTRYMHDPSDPHSLINNKVRAIFEDSRGTFWVGTADDGLHTMDRANGTFTRHRYNPAKPDQLSRPPLDKASNFDHITFIAEDGAGAIWIGTFREGINRFDPVTQKITHYDNKGEKKSGFLDNSGWVSYTSRDGILWVSTQSNNLYRIDPSQKRIPHVDVGTAVNSFVEEAPGVLWLGSETGLIHYDRNTGRMQPFLSDTLRPASLMSNWVNNLYRDRNGVFWVGTGNGLSRFNPNTRTFYRYRHDPGHSGSISPGNVGVVLEDRQGNYWVATQKGLNMLDRRTELLRHFRHAPDDSSSLSHNYVTDIKEGRSGELWVGTWFGGGLNQLMDRRKGKFSHYLKGSNITCIYPDTAGTLWVGTESGLYRKAPRSNKFTAFMGPAAELGTANVLSLVEDNSHNLWVATYSGLFKIDAGRSDVSSYGKRNGIDLNSLSCSVGYKTSQGELLFGNSNGFYAFFPSQMVINSRPPEIVFADFKISDQVVRPRAGGPFEVPLARTEQIQLRHNQNSFSIHFVGIHYSNPEQNRQLYMLEGYDNSWREAGTEKTAYYFNVPAGDYHFRVKAVSSDGLWAEKTLRLTITPPWWSSWWAYGFYMVLFVGGLWGLFRFRSRRLRAEKRLLEHKVTIRTAEVLKQKEEIAAQRDHLGNTLNMLRATQAQLIQAEKMASLGELTAGIAHEIQNPLNFVNNFSDVSSELVGELKQEATLQHTGAVLAIAADLEENLQKINNHGRRADAIVKNMLQHSRAGAGEMQPTNLNALAEEYLRLSYYGVRATDKTFNCSLDTAYDPTLEKVAVVPQELGRVLLNLFNNAFYAVQQKQRPGLAGYEPKVRVSTGSLHGHAFIRVWDNGTGIPDKVREKIFQPFFTTKPSGQGTGLGLSLSYDIITKGHRGEIRLATEEGAWTEFTVLLPLAPVAEELPATAPPARTIP